MIETPYQIATWLSALASLALASAAFADPTSSALEARLTERLRGLRGVMGIAAKHLDTGEAIAVNADVRFPTASTIKVAVMVEVFHQIAEGRLRKDQLLTLTDEVKVGGSGVLTGLRPGGQYSIADLLYLMIAASDNTATNLLIELVGTSRVNERMASHGLSQTRLYRPTFRDGHADVFPEEEKEFGLGSSTPREMARLMELIATGKVVSRPARDEMIAILARQQFRDMVPRLLPGEGAGVVVANKTGVDAEKAPDSSGIHRHIRADVGLVTTSRGRYVIAIYARQVEDTRWSVDNEALVTGAEVSRTIYDHFTRR